MKMDGRDSTECQNWENEDIIGINGKVYMTLKDKMSNSVVSSKREKGQWLEQRKMQGSSRFFILFLDIEPLLSSFPANPTVEILRDKKESCSTRRGLRVSSGFEEF